MSPKHTFSLNGGKNTQVVFDRKHKKNTQFYMDEEEDIHNDVENQHWEDFYDTCTDMAYVLQYNGILNTDVAFRDRLVVSEEMLERLDEKNMEDETRHQERIQQQFEEELQREQADYQMYIDDLMAFGEASLYESGDEEEIEEMFQELNVEEEFLHIIDEGDEGICDMF